MTPILTPTTEAQKRFNYALCRGRTCVERMFGQFKRRFSINRTGYRLGIENIPKAIVACAVLHNLAVDMKMPLPEEGEEEDEQPDEMAFADEQQNVPQNERQARQLAQRRRDELIARFE